VVPELDPLVRAYYERGEEADRLRGGFPSGQLELARTQELIRRHLPAGSLAVLDVGGGPGVYAAWLVGLGHRVHLVDPVPLHVAQAAAADERISAELGDARALTQDDASVDVVLLLGPLYHLLDAGERRLALREARRVLRPGGWLFAAAISRYAALFDLLVRADVLHEPGTLPLLRDVLATGAFRSGPDGPFTTAYFHRPSELADEVTAAGFDLADVFNVEGPGFVVLDVDRRWDDPERREALLEAARLIETEPEARAAAAHLLAVGRRPA
jgi:SAM-dependent methyltransferase